MFVRWLGAFGKSGGLSDSAVWELSQTERQVAVEALRNGVSYIKHAKIGLVVNHQKSQFIQGWTRDAYTVVDGDGTIKPSGERGNIKKNNYKNIDRFRKAINKEKDHHHTEAIFDCVIYSAVAVKRSASKIGKIRAKTVAERLDLPLKVIS